MAQDVRSIANFVLDVADAGRQQISNMQINKIVYFIHADYLVEFGRPLVSAKIEAWDHGPVFRELYSQFKRFGDSPIAGRAVGLSPSTGQSEKKEYSLTDVELRFLEPLVLRYSSMSAGALRALSHIEGGPWDQVWNHEGNARPTMQITDRAILDWYGRSAKH
jgi:uncharacterized phage-associated protein